MATDHTKDRLLVGNCLTTLKTLADGTIDSIVTDPPYELGFMGKSWDASGIAYQVALWEECLRVLKPGGHLLAFGGTRTYHRMAVAIEDAGFEIRDSIHWTYGSGFPKSLNISKAIDKASGKPRKTRNETRIGETGYEKEMPQVRARRCDDCGKCVGGTKNHCQCPADNGPQTTLAKKWDGWGTALKPSHEPIVVARKPLTGTVADTVLKHGTGGINIDASRISHNEECRLMAPQQNGLHNEKLRQGGRHAEVLELKPEGRFPANTLLTHNHDCQQTGTATDQPVAGKRTATFGTQETESGGNGSGGWSSAPVTTATYTCTPNCPVALLDQQQAEVSRFFHNSEWSEADDITPFIYQAKPGKKERNAGLDGLEAKRHSDRPSDDLPGGDNPRNRTNEAKQNFHPTVKPVELMRYLIRMVTPPGGVVLDPFLGSGTTAVAATLEGYAWKGCELTEDYLPIIKGRITWAVAEKKIMDKKAKQLTLEEQE